MKTTEIIKIVTSLSTIVFSFLMIFANTKYRKTRNLHDYKKTDNIPHSMYIIHLNSLFM